MNGQICLNHSVLDFMDAKIGRDSFVLEFGAGHSTIWFAERCGKLVTFETSIYWRRMVADELPKFPDCNSRIVFGSDPIEVKLTDSPDLALIDCRKELRADAMMVGWGNLKSGGWLIFDDAQRYEHQEAVRWLLRNSPISVELGWDPKRDIPAAKYRRALACRKP